MLGSFPVAATGADEDRGRVQVALHPQLFCVLGQGKGVLGRSQRGVPRTEPEVDLGEGAQSEQPLGRHLRVARVAHRGEVAPGAVQVVDRDAKRTSGGELMAVPADQGGIGGHRVEYGEGLLDPSHHAQAERLRGGR